ncbi:hypothetical protein Cni_G07539 [Canna indica]|uniref:Uncharacterized protein n=1 Tax=Canna indica TaxID=4628 RepID=A0AAQ3Q7G0_9LILI|nr:hypothetical protein Cni_G07539 [Canna indica]
MRPEHFTVQQLINRIIYLLRCYDHVHCMSRETLEKLQNSKATLGWAIHRAGQMRPNWLDKLGPACLKCNHMPVNECTIKSHQTTLTQNKALRLGTFLVK